jgi:hypothetical protein
MLKILLLDCSAALKTKLEEQGFDVESGTVGHCTGVRKLPSQVYEKDVFVYNPDSCTEREEPIGKSIVTKSDAIKDLSPEYDLKYLEGRITSGATFVAFVNRLSDVAEKQNKLYRWIPFMPPIEFTSDKIVWANSFASYPDSDVEYLAPIITTDNLSIPVMQKLKPPKPADFAHDVFNLFWNGHGHCLGVIILRGRGKLIVLPKYQSNEDVVDTFVHRVLPRIYRIATRSTLTDLFRSPDESAAQKKLDDLLVLEEKLREKVGATRVALAGATRAKANVIGADAIAKQLRIYYDHAMRQDDAALYYLYKIIEAIENKFGGEAAGIAAVGEQVAWKAVKRLANESYRDARHAPKPGDVIKKWSSQELKQCFTDTQKVVLAYFMTLFKPSA